MILDFEIKDNLKSMTEKERNMWADVYSSFNFYNAIARNDGEVFVKMLKDEETQNKCREAIFILAELKKAVTPYINWV